MNNFSYQSWSKVRDTELGMAAYMQLYRNSENGCDYHNVRHIVAMYDYLTDTNYPYDEALDWAILFHDIVYDANPDKELRSAKLFFEMNEAYGAVSDKDMLWNIESYILATIDHTIRLTADDSECAIVRADLHGLANQFTAFQNFGSIMSESMELYGIDMVTFAENSEKFMTELLSRVSSNIITDPDHHDFHSDVYDGILYTIKLSQFIQGKLK